MPGTIRRTSLAALLIFAASLIVSPAWARHRRRPPPPTVPVNTVLPSISGTPQQGDTLTARQGTWTGTAPISYSYSWSDGATGPTDTLTAADVGQKVRVTVTASNAAGQTPATSASVGPVTGPSPPPPAPVNTTPPAITGTLQKGDTLTTDNGSWTNSPTSYGYQWRDCDMSGLNCQSITGANSNSYTLTVGDVGHTIVSVVTAKNAGGSTPQPSSPTAVVTNPPSPSGFPTPASVGLPVGWTPQRTVSSDMTITTAGADVHDIRFTNSANLIITAPNVTVERIDMQGGQINNEPGNTCTANGMDVRNSTFELAAGQTYDTGGHPGIIWGGYTAENNLFWNRDGGYFVGAKSAGCGPVSVSNTFMKLFDNGDCNLHAEGFQGYDGNAATVNNVVIDARGITCGTAAFFYPKNQGNTSLNVNHLLVAGAGWTFTDGMPGTISDLEVADGTDSNPYGTGHYWAYGPINVDCAVVGRPPNTWSASIVALSSDYTHHDSTSGPNRANYPQSDNQQVVDHTVRSQPCDTGGGN